MHCASAAPLPLWATSSNVGGVPELLVPDTAPFRSQQEPEISAAHCRVHAMSEPVSPESAVGNGASMPMQPGIWRLLRAVLFPFQSGRVDRAPALSKQHAVQWRSFLAQGFCNPAEQHCHAGECRPRTMRRARPQAKVWIFGRPLLTSNRSQQNASIRRRYGHAVHWRKSVVCLNEDVAPSNPYVPR